MFSYVNLIINNTNKNLHRLNLNLKSEIFNQSFITYLGINNYLIIIFVGYFWFQVSHRNLRI